ncbi:phospholipase D-like domain-containing protein [Shimia haliotis]|uniref:Phospholipase D n=1 Tax=Shimia haliotis TaxID=1280847 RepID=A0A1I4CIW8_9RHOB|nr:phospholipase D family protein [Shimia haliotis]SFK80229.1 Phosphatidylserine/phosphatidylglycerophosphate/cardiolipin synthase [Shimia haliotis]
MVLTPRAFCFLLFAALALTACAKVPFDAPREPSFATSQTVTSRSDVIEALSLRSDSAYFELNNGTDALGMRLRMIEKAEHSIDISTFLIKSDTASAILAHRLFDAADRGVRVRWLVDDVFTTASDKDLAVLDAHPNIELRIFNPTSRNAPKAMGFVWDFARVNRRMHIKTFVVDNVMGIVGGRNFADEYYALKPTEVFADYDLALFGSDVAEINTVFDSYWNDPYSLPVHTLLPKSAPPPPQIALSEWTFDPQSREVQAYRKAIDTPYLQQIENGTIAPYRGTSKVIADPPEKLRNPNGKGPHVLGEAFFAAIGAARNEVTLITPYFVPENYGAAFYERLALSGVRLRIVTNSLASTNHAYVHGGYARHRSKLLAAGVELYEIRHDAVEALGLMHASDAPDITLHSKLAIIDDHSVLVGSLNLDPRSIKTNAEIGLLVQSPAYARALLADLDENLENFAYRVTASETSLIWSHTPQGAPTRETTSDPDATLWRRFLSVLPQWFGLEGLT